MTTNFYAVSDTQHFQELLSQDLDRVSLINFWAPWAEPCRQMNEVVMELSKKYPAALFLQVEAEEQADIAESFDIDAVPAFVLLRGHTLLGRVAGADATGLAKLVEKHATTPSYNPLSRTNRKPAEAPSTTPSTTVEEKLETTEELNQRLQRLMNQSAIVLFMKGSPDSPKCGFSRKIVGLLRDENIEFAHFDILTDENVRQGLKKLNDWPTYPQLIVKGELVGGLDIVQEMIENGELKDVVKD